MKYEESNLLSLLKKQDIYSLFLAATNLLCQTKSLFEEKEQLQQKNEQLKEAIDKAIELHNNFAKENAMLIFENGELIKFMNNLLDILKEVSE